MTQKNRFPDLWEFEEWKIQKKNRIPEMSPQDIFVVNYDGAWREEIEIEKRGQNEYAFTGTITMTK